MMFAKRRSKDEVAKAWHSYWAAAETSDARNGNKWVHSYLSETLRNNPEENWELILEILASAPNKEHIRKLAACPLRELLNQHYDEFRERIKDESKHDSRFLYAIGKTFVFNEINQNELKTIRRTNGPRTIAFDFKLSDFDKDDAFRLASACKKYWSAPSGKSLNDPYPEIDEATNLQWDNPEKLWEVILILLKSADSKQIIRMTATLLLSPLLAGNFDDFIDPLSIEVANCPAFMTALDHVLIDDIHDFQELMRLRDSV